MNMDLKDKRKFKYYDTFRFALQGILVAMKQEKNIRFHLIVSAVVLILAVFLSLSKTEWMLLVIVISGMLVLEMINTAIERVVDLVTLEYHPLAKQAKDVAAGAVLIFATAAIIIGILIFLPKILVLF
jgi:undecaprenol kinase